MSTVTLKKTARNLANETGIEYAVAYNLVTTAVTDLRIKRVDYHTALRSWTISTADSVMLVETLAERND